MNPIFYEVYDAWLESGLSIAEFHRSLLPTLDLGQWSVWTLYHHFRDIRREREETEAAETQAAPESEASAASEPDTEINVVTLPQDIITEAANGKARPKSKSPEHRLPQVWLSPGTPAVQGKFFFNPPSSSHRPPERSPVKLTLPGGAVLEFSSEAPEQLALGLASLCGGPA